jgi:hypothetical protein
MLGGRIPSEQCEAVTKIGIWRVRFEALQRLPSSSHLFVELKSGSNITKMIHVPAKVLSNEKRGERYCVTVEIELSNFRRSFNCLRFGDRIPCSGSYRDGTLELRYYQDPGFKVGERFPLWLIEFCNRYDQKAPNFGAIGHLLGCISFSPLKRFTGLFRVRKSFARRFFGPSQCV